MTPREHYEKAEELLEVYVKGLGKLVTPSLTQGDVLTYVQLNRSMIDMHTALAMVPPAHLTADAEQ